MPKLWEVHLSRKAMQDKYSYKRGDQDAAALGRALRELQENPNHPDSVQNEVGLYEVTIYIFTITYDIDRGDENIGRIIVVGIE